MPITRYDRNAAVAVVVIVSCETRDKFYIVVEPPVLRMDTLIEIVDQLAFVGRPLYSKPLVTAAKITTGTRGPG